MNFIKQFRVIFSVLIVTAVLTLLNSFTAATAPTLSCKEILEKMVKTVNEVERLKYNLKLTERVKNKYNNFGSSVKVQRKPRQLYLYTSGIEVLWLEGKNKGKALVKPNSFPYVNLNLDPMGSLMRQDQHHTINEMGFDYVATVIDLNIKRVGINFDDYFKLEGEETINNRPCYKISITNKDFAFVNYTVLKGEDLTKIARKLNVAEYMILENNSDKVDDFEDVKEGQVIKVPNAYAKFVICYIDKLFFLPIGTRIYDHKGLFEQYDYYFVQLNPKIDAIEFSKENKAYGF